MAPLPPLGALARRSCVAILALAFLTAACSAGTSVAPGGEAPGLRASFILANPSGLLALDEAGRSLGRVVALPANSAPATPALHPGGKSLAFAITKVPTSTTGFGSDIQIVNLDGTGLRSLVEHEGDTVFYASPRFDPTGNLLYVHRRAALVRNGAFVGNDDTIVRIDLRTEQRTTVLTDAADPTISPDGRTLVYVRIKDGRGEGLWTAGVDGTGARPLLTGRDTFSYLQTPRFSPAGREIAFSAAGHTASAAPVRSVAMRDVGGGAPRAHLGIPSEIYIVGADGAGLRSVGQTGDDVTPAWSPDGGRIAYIGTGAFFVLELANGNLKSLAQGNDFFFGDLLWIR